MSDFLSRLLDRSFASAPTLRPRHRTVFEPVVETSLDASRLDDSIVRQNREPTGRTDPMTAQRKQLSNTGTPVDSAAESTASDDAPRQGHAQSHAALSPFPDLTRRLDVQSRILATGQAATGSNPHVSTRAGSRTAAVESRDDVVQRPSITEEPASATAADQDAQPSGSIGTWTAATTVRSESADSASVTTRAPAFNDAGRSSRESASTRSGDSRELLVPHVHHASAANGSSPAPQVTVTIGRVEIRAPQSTPRAAPSRRPPQLSLEQYLRQRGGGRQS